MKSSGEPCSTVLLLERPGSDGCVYSMCKGSGYVQLELEAGADNARAIAMYKKAGFVEYGRNSKGFHSRTAGFQKLIYMRLELEYSG